MGNPTILLIEDEPNVAFFLTLRLNVCAQECVFRGFAAGMRPKYLEGQQPFLPS